MKLTTLTLTALLLSTGAMAQSITSPSGVVLADDLARPDTWRFHERERSCDPNMWQEPVGHNVWMNVTCETLTNSSKESRRERRAARDAAEEAANQPPVDVVHPVPQLPADPEHPVTPPADPEPTPPAADDLAAEAPVVTPSRENCNASANNGRGGNGRCDNGKGKGRGRG